jgi:NAD(P)-dependent dehydrogenase (short-subunit alcohol dehydrogenase family)
MDEGIRLTGKRALVTAAQAKEFARREAIQNRIVEPDELAPMAVLPCSDADSAITGQMINVDGGFKV